jgi:hypothetical protein
VTALMAWPNFHREMEREVDKQVAAPAETRTPSLHRARQSLTKSADGRVATGLVWARRKGRFQESQIKIYLTQTGILMEGHYTL